MKKVLPLLLVLLLSLSFVQPQSAAAKVMWGDMELKKGQIGRVTMLKDVNIYTKSDDEYVKSGTAKKNQLNRVYTNRKGYLGIGGGKFVKNDSSVKYETPSQSRLQAANGVRIVKKTYPGTNFIYPQVTGMFDKKAEKKINDELYSIAQSINETILSFEEEEAAAREDWDDYGYGDFWDWEYDFTFEIHYNQEHRLSVLFREYAYTGGAHGMSGIYTLNFDCLTGNTINLSSAIKGKTKTVRNYAYNDLRNQEKRGEEMLLLDSVNQIVINDSDRPWVYNAKGVKLFFQEYEVAPYASGNPEVIVPSVVYN
ncbi:DUF3298 and DUF4163 domain-containing protein [Metabacillus litoralis]|uniref:DUF3298 and DUF4163 domain-containing protein n=1 Tax=Metabacillus TaxID=2675233 RepID=UPI001B90A4C0|nr:DUF3298 and DUF4163 domain-containing protein [Metabacillus litoralis]UHA61454.1 DUF3298 and DUF4163 domain-containing protein [Metabacillus litoralis]